MAADVAQRPEPMRKSSRLPGGFETEDEMEIPDFHSSDVDSTQKSPYDLSSLLDTKTNDGSTIDEENKENAPGHDTAFNEEEMNKKLSDVESSFMPEPSHISSGDHELAGADDTFAFGMPNENLAIRSKPSFAESTDAFTDSHEEMQDDDFSPVPQMLTKPINEETGHSTSTEQPGNEVEQTAHQTPNTSALETLSSSPTAAAAARSVNRVISMVSLGGYETADERAASPTKSIYHNVEDDFEITPRKTKQNPQSPRADSPLQAQPFDGGVDLVDGFAIPNERLNKRPRYLNSRLSQQRLSYSSLVSSNTDTASDATVGADFALQSGGALPEPRLHRRGKLTLSRSTSLGSMASGISSLSDEEVPKLKHAPGGSRELSPLPEEQTPTARRVAGGDLPLTPRASEHEIGMPTDTVLTKNVRDIEVPGTFARHYRQTHRSISPEKNFAGMTPGPSKGGKSMTLKEHRSTVDRLSKENFDLKMKIHFLDQALQRRSEDGVKEMITENVQLKSDKVQLEKDNHGLRKQLRDLQKKLDENDQANSPDNDQGYGTDEERSPTAEEEVVYLRERLETTEIEVQKLQNEQILRETERRRMAEIVKSLSDNRASASDVGSREERDMWKDMMESETAAREQAESEVQRLREELDRVRHDNRPKKYRIGGSVVSQSTSDDRNGTNNPVEMDRLRHENSELQKLLSAQATTLGTRNKEKERLYEEIENLKLGRLNNVGTRSVAGDSIFERSASRARANSRASNGTRVSRLSDPEREVLENKIGELRDQVSELRLLEQRLKDQLDQLLTECDQIEAEAMTKIAEVENELREVVAERDHALTENQHWQEELESLTKEYQIEIDGIGDENEQLAAERDEIQNRCRNMEEENKALREEITEVRDGFVRIEETSQQNRERHEAASAELDDANRELETIEEARADLSDKLQTREVELQTLQSKIQFLEEANETESMSKAELEAVLKKTHHSLDSERDKSRELERRLGEERHQREVVDGKEKQDVQRVMNELNRENTNVKEETRRLKKALMTRDTEVATWKERLSELEGGLRDCLGNTNGSRSSLLTNVSRMQRELETTIIDLQHTRRRLDERETTLQQREALMESSGLEYRKISDLLERERNSRKADKNSFEQSLKGHQQASRALSQNNARITELESARQADRKRLSQLEQQYKEQLSERNTVLLTVWKRLSSMCGPDWTHSNSLINGNLPSQEVIGNMLFWPGFSRNLLLAAKQVEGILVTFREKIKHVERDLFKEFHSLEHTLELRSKKIERIEEMWNNMKQQQAASDALSHTRSSRHTPEMKKLKGENRLLKAELNMLHQQSTNGIGHSRGQSRSSMLSGSNDGASSFQNGGIPPRGSSTRGLGAAATTSSAMAATLMRHHSTNVVEHLSQGSNNSDRLSQRSNSISSKASDRKPAQINELMLNAPQNGSFPPSTTGTDAANGQETKWIHRLRELERRLKAEREARLLDRDGARKRLEERDAVNEDLRMELEREKMRREVGVSRPATSAEQKEKTTQ